MRRNRFTPLILRFIPFSFSAVCLSRNIPLKSLNCHMAHTVLRRDKRRQAARLRLIEAGPQSGGGEAGAVVRHTPVPGVAHGSTRLSASRFHTRLLKQRPDICAPMAADFHRRYLSSSPFGLPLP